MLIYQDDIGGDNTDKTPLGGIVVQRSVASSMLESIANPIKFYGGIPYTVINQSGHSKDLYDYYWTSYSRGTDGKDAGGAGTNESSWHNDYLDGYIPLKAKSIYDPCPYSYRIPSNGTFNQFTFNPGWTWGSYLGGLSCNMNNLGESWFAGLGRRSPTSGEFVRTGDYGFYRSGTARNNAVAYTLIFVADKKIWSNSSEYQRSYGFSVRCIEDCDPRADQTPTCDIYKAKHNPILLRKSPTAPTQ